MATKWAFFKRYDIPDIVDPSKIYLTRWRIIQTPWFGLFLHAIRMSDHDRHTHDHPWNFISLILKGGYIEKRLDTDGRPFFSHRGAGTFAYRKAEGFHAISDLDRNPVWTLVMLGRNRRKWGYMTENGWVDHNTYHKQRMYDVEHSDEEN